MATPGPAAAEPADLNRDAFTSTDVASGFAFEGWTDHGEISALRHAADLVRGEPILDIGMGGGRTTSLLRLISSDYQAIDYAPAMVEVARRRHPAETIRAGDARDLSWVPDGSQGLVVFSFNGIDAVSHGDRQQIFAEVARVLRPGGVFVYSALNLGGPLFALRPWHTRPLPWDVGSLRPTRPAGPRRALGFLIGVLTGPGRHVRAYRNWWRNRRLTVHGDSWAMAPLDAHEFGLVVHFTTLAEEQRALGAAGLEIDEVYAAEDGSRVEAATETAARWWHIVARREPGRRAS